MLTQKALKKALHYDPEAGVFIRKTSKRTDLVGLPCGSVDGNGYIHIRVCGNRYKAHRLAIFYMTGRWPERDTDHIDLDRTNNRWNNIRPATERQNQGNVRVRSDNVAGIKGVTKVQNRYQARITLANGKRKFLGLFVSAKNAGRVYAAEARAVFGEFWRA